MNFKEKLTRINNLYSTSIANNDLEKANQLLIGAFDLLSKQFPQEIKEILEKYDIIEDFNEFAKESNDFTSYLQSYYLDFQNLKIIASKNNKEVIIPFFNINAYLDSKAISDKLDLFICLSFVSNNLHFEVYQLYNALQIIKNIKK